MIKVLIADDQAMVRTGFRWLLESEPDIHVVAEAENGHAAIEEAQRHRPDVVLMDIRMPLLDGVAATERIVASGDAHVLVLTTYDLDEYVFGALAAGAAGFLLKDAPAEELSAAIRVVARGEALLAPAVTRRVIDAFVRRRPFPQVSLGLTLLTPREREILGLVARGLSNQEIAAQLFVSEATTKTHVSNMLSKLGLRDRVQAVIFAYEQGLAGQGKIPPSG